MEEENKDWCKKTKKAIEEQIEKIAEEEINADNITYLGKIVDIHKDLVNEEYWKEKIMRYRGYDNYGNYDTDNYNGGRRRDSRGRYMDGMSYGRRGVPGSGRGHYRGHEALENVYDTYDEYEENRTYGEGDTKRPLKQMLNSAEDFFAVIMQEADSPEEIKMVKETARRISEM